MKHNVLAPSVGESITEVSILKWAKQTGEAVKKGELLLEIESDKATVEIVAEASGVITQLKPAGERIPIGEVVGQIDDEAKPTVTSSAPAAAASKPAAAPAAGAAAPKPAAPAPSAPAGGGASPYAAAMQTVPGAAYERTKAAPAQAPQQVVVQGGRPTHPPYIDQPGDRRVQMSMLRSRIADRLKTAQEVAAILTTFNEVDMTAVMKIRAEHKDSFKSKHGVGLSFMSFFTRASVLALKAVPEVNALIDGRDVVYRDYFDIGIAVGTERGLIVPVVRNAGDMSFVDIEKKIGELAVKGRDGKLSIAELSGGTFTISNGGTYGSLLSAPILNPPQSGILGMHKIQERPVAINGKVEIRPMMYVALSYDHRLIDGKGAVTWLVTLKDALENPEKLGFTY
jgi:2-oxoglutarate dehydrogenase E2 component (dihydrolipoamide succinyltransferase)